MNTAKPNNHFKLIVSKSNEPVLGQGGGKYSRIAVSERSRQQQGGCSHW